MLRSLCFFYRVYSCTVLDRRSPRVAVYVHTLVAGTLYFCFSW